ncbi:FBD domain [Arabidopsis thaliana x Arabidopsis arenosa]|uniref:FBD domain n=1 Tax=Arabidopsis thaliana x Arabidopsis arenosa TaxID=1240361 RepID=A0A8T2F1S5_9BRAS|nr:FBD domain [Arabidopsis thaliana x Arabidopsis arenosa]
MFENFVDRVLSLQGDYPINKFSLTCRDFVDPICVSRWISNVMERGVSDLDLCCIVDWDDGTMPPCIFVSKALVHLRIETSNGVFIDVEDVFLPKLKTLYLNKVLLQHCSDNGFVKLITSCHVLEDLFIMNLCWDGYLNRSVSSKTLKRLTFFCEDVHDVNPEIVSFDTPNLLYLVYHDCVADKYKEMNFDSLVYASICLQMTSHQRTHASYEHMVANATDFLMGISNVQILELFANTIEVLTFCCEQIPVFKNLVCLIIKTDQNAGWESLPVLLKNCPDLESLIFDGLHHNDTIKCEDVDGCLCKSSRGIPSCLSSSPVQFLTIWKFGEICDDYDDMEKQIELVMYFLETMPNLEEMKLFYDTQIDEDVISKLQMALRRTLSLRSLFNARCYQPSCSGIIQRDDVHEEKPHYGSFLHQRSFSSSMILSQQHMMRSPSHFPLCSPFGVSTYRPMSTSHISGSDESGDVNHVAETLTDLVQQDTVIEVADAAIDSSIQLDFVQQIVHNVHSLTGLNWWASIVFTTFLIRGVTIPLMIECERWFSKRMVIKQCSFVNTLVLCLNQPKHRSCL